MSILKNFKCILALLVMSFVTIGCATTGFERQMMQKRDKRQIISEQIPNDKVIGINEKVVRKGIMMVKSKDEDCISLDKAYYNKISFIHKKTFVGIMEVDEFRQMLEASERTVKIMEAEKAGRVKVILKDDPWRIDLGKKFKTKGLVEWYDQDNVLLKRVVISMELSRHDGGWAADFLEVYDKIARVGFPVTIAIMILLILLL